MLPKNSKLTSIKLKLWLLTKKRPPTNVLGTASFFCFMFAFLGSQRLTEEKGTKVSEQKSASFRSGKDIFKNGKMHTPKRKRTLSLSSATTPGYWHRNERPKTETFAQAFGANPTFHAAAAQNTNCKTRMFTVSWSGSWKWAKIQFPAFNLWPNFIQSVLSSSTASPIPSQPQMGPSRTARTTKSKQIFPLSRQNLIFRLSDVQPKQISKRMARGSVEAKLTFLKMMNLKWTKNAVVLVFCFLFDNCSFVSVLS